MQTCQRYLPSRKYLHSMFSPEHFLHQHYHTAAPALTITPAPSLLQPHHIIITSTASLHHHRFHPRRPTSHTSPQPPSPSPPHHTQPQPLTAATTHWSPTHLTLSTAMTTWPPHPPTHDHHHQPRPSASLLIYMCIAHHSSHISHISHMTSMTMTYDLWLNIKYHTSYIICHIAYI